MSDLVVEKMSKKKEEREEIRKEPYKEREKRKEEQRERDKKRGGRKEKRREGGIAGKSIRNREMIKGRNLLLAGISFAEPGISVWLKGLLY